MGSGSSTAETWKVFVLAGLLGACWSTAGYPVPPTGKSFELLKEQGRFHALELNTRHTYHVKLRENQLLSATFQQLGVDIHLELRGPTDERLAVIDSPNGSRGQEPVLLVARRTGSYKIVVEAGGPPEEGAVYLIGKVALRPATPRDRDRADALRSYFAARQLEEKDPRKRLQVYQAAASALEKTAAPRDIRAHAEGELGKICADLSLWKESARSYERAAQLYQQLGMPRDQAVALIGAGFAEIKIPSVDQALKHFKQALSLAQANGYELEDALASSHLGVFYADRRDAWTAKPYLEHAISLFKKLQNPKEEATALRGLALLYKNLGEDGEALKIYQYGLQKLSLSAESRAAMLTDLGNLYTQLGGADKALRFLQQALALQKRSGDLQGQADTLIGIGLAYSRKGDFNTALLSYRRALEIHRIRKDPRSQAASLMNIGWVLGSLRRYGEATKSFESARALIRELKQPTLESAALLGLAWIERLRRNLPGAIEMAEASLARIESARSDIPDREYRLAYFSSLQDVYDFTVEVIMEQYGLQKSRDLLEKALGVIERARSRTLLDALGEREGDATSRLAPVLSARQIQSQVLDPDTILLEYYIGKTKSYIFLVTRDRIESFALPSRDEIAPRVKETYKALAARPSPKTRRMAIEKATELSRILLRPLAGRLGQKRLLIVPGETLQLVPFEVLPDPDAPSVVPPGLAWPAPWLLQHEILLEPSASALAGIRKAKANQRPAFGLLAVLADAVYELSDPRLPRDVVRRGMKTGRPPGDLERLEDSAREAEAIVIGLPPAKVLKEIGFNANRDLVTSGRLVDYRVLHLAVHSYYLFDKPEESALVLSRYDSLGRPRNGLLKLKDITAQDLREDLVVLSACSSALGREVRGEGIVGWPWAFLSAGASQVVMSFWDIGDKSTADLMQLFYRGMLQGMPSSLALREAQRQMWKEGKPHWAWGGFVAQGEWSVQPFSLNKTPPFVSSQGGDPRSPAVSKKQPLAKKTH